MIGRRWIRFEELVKEETVGTTVTSNNRVDFCSTHMEEENYIFPV
jgi:hypothetical protein